MRTTSKSSLTLCIVFSASVAAYALAGYAPGGRVLLDAHNAIPIRDAGAIESSGRS
ncbi:MAG: hypothetical protein ABIS29_02640 [Vicinamibacterales bacterium]